MNKKLNSAIFLLVATIANFVLVAILAIAVFIPYAQFIAPRVDSSFNLLALVLIMIGAMAGSFPLYKLLIGWFQKKVDFERYFDPIFKNNSKKRRD